METQPRPASPYPSTGLLGWLRFGRPEGSAPDEAPAPREDPTRHARRYLIEQIGLFLIDNGLEITQQNLATALSIYSGLNPRLRREVDQLREQGSPITQAWLDRATASEAQGEDASVKKLVHQLEQGIADFSRSTSDARTVTRRYGDALAEHVEQLDASPDPGEIITELANYARSMLERSRKAEAELRHSEQEAASLRRNLDRARRDAEVDFLTGLPNRRAFEVALERQYTEAQAAGDALSVAFCDIDHFKLVNDTHGHEAGDRILCVVAKTLSQISGEKCHIARHGGEEFVMLFRGSTPEEAFAMLDQARIELASRKLVNRRTEQPFGQITFSGGIADVFAHANPRSALAAADEALYRAKEGGRNQIRLAGQAD
ncbi:GGDEF domain-containing protein [Altererythrobacter sp. KTW20L]|uniref:GGDEF domain-containing protein n=1 Tax=Altererythrobacter sp. KTW20L TaxID=2942210 RepID=UPI0020BF5743|nr:GGDEF domain-containing protein [Altererythrobacter sp. KTW20L]MCL6249623.1 GGDEF domain-containing protein [Altererythrobacter sp. KTW20L]